MGLPPFTTNKSSMASGVALSRDCPTPTPAPGTPPRDHTPQGLCLPRCTPAPASLSKLPGANNLHRKVFTQGHSLKRPGEVAVLLKFIETKTKSQTKGRQRNMFQKKQQNKPPEKTPNETEISNLSDKEFKETVIRMLTKLGRRMEEFSENFNKDLENIRKNQSKVKNTKIEKIC